MAENFPNLGNRYPGPGSIVPNKMSPGRPTARQQLKIEAFLKKACEKLVTKEATLGHCQLTSHQQPYRPEGSGRTSLKNSSFR